jgi:AraC family cel operon transcriptional repressor
VFVVAYYPKSASEVIDPENDSRFEHISSFQHVRNPHSHDFYELFLQIEGRVRLICNESELVLEPGGLGLIRPKDVSRREYIVPGRQINISISMETIRALIHYLGEGFPSFQLIDGPFPPYKMLSKTEKRIVEGKLDGLKSIIIEDNASIRTRLRIILLELFVNHFSETGKEGPEIDTASAWLYSLIEEMGKKENFIEGIPALLSISGRSHEYLCRAFKHNLNTTPLRFINELRLNYAANSLIYTDMQIIDICFESGFKNLSHFYHLFRAKYNHPPHSFRKEHKTKSL